MGHFDPWTILYCQNDEVSTVCTPWFQGREVVADTPTVSRSELLLGHRSSSAQRGILIDLGIDRFLGDYD